MKDILSVYQPSFTDPWDTDPWISPSIKPFLPAKEPYDFGKLSELLKKAEVKDLFISSWMRTEYKVELSIMVPGFSKEEIEISMEDYKVTVKTTKNESNKCELAKAINQDFYFDKDCDMKTLDAGLENGVLTLSVLRFPKPKKEVTKITIK